MKRVLVVDDSQTIRHEVAAALQQAGFETVEARDGLAGLECARQQPFSMIILDVNMPRMGGLELLDHLKQDAVTSGIPVLMLTTEAQPSLIQRARKAGAKGWMIKPVKMTQIVSTVAALTA